MVSPSPDSSSNWTSPGSRSATGADEFVFYDGPPFANGLPHYGHLLTGFVKDVVPRYQTMRGKRSSAASAGTATACPPRWRPRRSSASPAGGHHRARHRPLQRPLPHARCCGYTAEWDATSPARPAGSTSANDYKTMDLSYMESVMWAFKQLCTTRA
jgi:isoleucyl-tRNA synthetase